MDDPKKQWKHGHRCQLPAPDDEWRYPTPPNASYLTTFMEFVKEQTYVSSANPRCKDFFRSMAAIAKEQQRHLSKEEYRRVIHPFSKFAKWREIIMMFVWLAVFAVDPFYSTFLMIDFVVRDRYIFWPKLVQFLLNVGVALDISTNFFMGYIMPQTREIVLDRRKIVRKYLRTYFFFDVAALLNSVVPLCLPFLSRSQVMYIHQLFVFRLARLSTMRQYFYFLLKVLKLRDGCIQIINLGFFTLFFLHWWTCYLALVPLLTYVFGWKDEMSWTNTANVRVTDEVDLVTRYLEHLLTTMCHFYGAGIGSSRSMNPQEMYTFSLIILSGISYYTYAIAVTCQLFGTVNISGTKYDEFIHQVEEYAITKKLPQQLKRRLFMYYEYKFQRKFFFERAIFDSLSEHLRLEIVLYSCRHLIRCVHIFRGLSRPAIGTILAKLKQEVFLPGDEISGMAIDTDLCYFISYGTIACYLTSDGTELIHLEDGDYFEQSADGEEDVTTKAIETCDVYTIPRNQMLICRMKFPEIAGQVRRIEALKDECIIKSLEQRRDKTHGDILKELSYKHIINKGERR